MTSRATTSQLVTLLQSSGASAHGLADPPAGWPAVLDLAADHGLLPAFWAAMVRGGVQPLPPSLQERALSAPISILHEAYTANAERVADLRDQGDLVLGALSDAGLPALPLKGLHGLLDQWWAEPAQRVMVDIDVLVAPGHLDEAMTIVDGLGYRDLGTEDPEGTADHQMPALGIPGRLGSLEMHSAPLVLRRAGLLSSADLFADAVTVPAGDREVQVPSATHALVLAIGHAQLQDDGARFLRLPLRALHDVATMVGRGVTDAVDWAEVTARFEQEHELTALAGFAVALDELFAIELPVPRRRGDQWLRATWWATDHPAAAQRYRETLALPRALAGPRMARLHDAHTPLELTVARMRHLARGLRRRLRSGRADTGPS